MRQKKVKKYFDETVLKMKNLNIYKSEYDEAIQVYATLLHQYDVQFKEYAESGYIPEIEFINGNGQESYKPNPLIKILENLRRDIKTFSDILCLNPKANSAKSDNQKQNKMLNAPTIPLRVYK